MSDIDLFDPFRYFIPNLKAILNLKEKAPMLRTYNYLFNYEEKNYRIIFRDENDLPNSWFVDINIPAFSEESEDTVKLIVEALNDKEAAKPKSQWL